MSSFFDYEKENNAVIKAILKENDLKQFILLNEATILAPQSVTLDNVAITKDFLLTHIIITNSKKTEEWCTMNGILGKFFHNRETLHVLSTKHNLPSFNPLFEYSALFESQSEVFKADKDIGAGIQVLREGHITIDTKTIVPLILIAEPISFEGSDWSRSPPIQKSFSAPPKPLTENKESSESSRKIRFTSERSKPKALRDFLQQYEGLLSTGGAPLFPDTTPIPEAQDTEVTNKRASFNAATSKTSSFFQKLKQPAAADIVKAFKSFLKTFTAQKESSNLQETMEKQGAMVRAFVSSMEDTILQHPLWKDATEDEIENIAEGIEKYILTKLYDCTFQTHIADPENDSLAKRIQQLQFIKPENLDIKPQYINEASLQLACNELVKINNYKTPRDKLICILNCCKVIYNIINKANNNALGADEFLPILIYVVLKANPKYLHTNVQFISCFRNPSKMITESGYYFTNLVSAVTFIKTLDSSSLTIDAEEFNKLMARNAEDEKRRLASSTEEVKSTSSTEVELGTSPTELQPSPNLFTDEDVKHAASITQEERELLAQQHPLFTVNVESLKVGDIGLLLHSYKNLLIENFVLKKQLQSIKGSL